MGGLRKRWLTNDWMGSTAVRDVTRWNDKGQIAYIVVIAAMTYMSL